MIAVVQCYIHCRKNVEVNIYIRDDRDVLLLGVAYKSAVQYFKSTNTIITQL